MPMDADWLPGSNSAHKDEFKVGDRVVIRDWDDMAEEFPVSAGDIMCECVFTSAMRRLCGLELTITGSHDRSFKLDKRVGFSISADMVRLAEPEIPIDVDESVFFGILSDA